jgi:hypothetical protein
MTQLAQDAPLEVATGADESTVAFFVSLIAGDRLGERKKD